MSTLSSNVMPWVALVGLGAFHGLNPAMGWLFAVALGLHRHSRSVVLLALAPIALGHAAAIGAVLIAFIAFGMVLDVKTLGNGAGLILMSWALWHWFYGHRVRPKVGMRTGLIGLGLWACMTAVAHGAGLMVVPAVLSLCMTSGSGEELIASTSVPVALAALAIHTGAMLAVIGTIGLVVYDKFGVAFLRRGWINLDILWIAALVASGVMLILRT
jgi:hypothetical protein